jgi:hypothetical protein
MAIYDLPSDMPSALPSSAPMLFFALSGSDVPSSIPSDLPSASPSIVPTPKFTANDFPVTEPSSIISDLPSMLPTPTPITSSPSATIVANDLGYTCEDYLAGGYEEPFTVCYSPSVAAISGMSAPLGNETELPPAAQVYWYNYTIYNPKDDAQSYVISVERSGDVLNGGSGTDLTECQYVAVEGMECASCSYCGNETMSADCTNIHLGRVVTCEPLVPLFFPFESDAA